MFQGESKFFEFILLYEVNSYKLKIIERGKKSMNNVLLDKEGNYYFVGIIGLGNMIQIFGT